MAVEDRAERLDVVAEALGRDRRVLDERGGPARALAGGHQQPEAGLADLGQRVLLGGGLGAQRVVAVAVLAPGGLEAVELRAGLPGVSPKNVTNSSAPGLALDRRAPSARTRAWSARARGSSRRSSRSPRPRASSASCGRGDRLVDRVEVADGELARVRQLDQPDRRLGDRDERALGAGDEACARSNVARERSRAGSRRTGASGAGSPRRSRARGRAGSPAARGRSRPRACPPARGGRAPPRRPARSGRRAVGEHDLELVRRGRSSCRRRSSGCPRSCCRSCRRAWPGWRSRCRGRTRARAARRRG